MRLKALFWILLCLPSFRGMAQDARVPAVDPAPILRGVGEIRALGTPGLLAVWGPDAAVVVAAKSGEQLAPLVAAARLGEGRVVCFSHTGYVSAGDGEAVRTLLRNAVLWAADADPAARPRVGIIDTDCGPVLRDSCDARPLGRGWDKELGGLDAVVIRGWVISEAQVDALRAFVVRGGGLVAGQTAWAWAVPPGRTLSHNPLNRVVAGAGLAWTGSYAGTTAPEGFKAEPGPATLHAERALETLAAKPADAGEARQAGATLIAAARALPKDDALLRPRLSRLVADHAGALAPTERAPLGPDRPLDRVLLAYQVQVLEDLPPEEVRAHAAAAAFPGDVPAGAMDIADAEQVVPVSVAQPRWQSTGLYAPAGKIVTVTVPDAWADAGLRVRIGCHKDQLWHLREWKRVPEITLERSITEPRTRVASAFGGPIFLIMPPGERPGGTMLATIGGAVRAPMFVLGRTDVSAWRSAIRSAPAPWAELVGRRVILSVPSDSIRALDDPGALLEFWDRILDAQADLAGIPRERRSPERYVPDVQISAGYMHSGYPIMTHLDAVKDMTTLDELKQGPWGLLHEMGHNHQQGDWTFEGTGEVTCNVFAMYCIERVCGLPWKDGHEGLKDRDRKVGAYRAGGAEFEAWKKDPFLALAMYAQLVEGFGWETFKRVFAEYRGLPAAERPKTEEDKRDQWMVRFSRACGKNLGPFFDSWGVPVSEGAKGRIADLPAWMP